MHRQPREELSESQLKEALYNCAQEPIHIPGSIQPHGFLIAFCPSTQRVEHVSDNIEQLLGRNPAAVIGKKLHELFDADNADILLDATTKPPLEPLESTTIHINGTPYDAVANRSDDKTLLEFEPQPANKSYSADKFYYEKLRHFAISIREAKDLTTLYNLLVDEVFKLTGIDRVKLYKFDEDWNGEVVAEARNDYMPSYLGLHFPASDIPEQARKLYMKSYLRIIPDISYRPAAIVPTLNQNTGKPLDLSQSVLRSVSPVHIQYLDNMCIRASMSISIIQSGKLWGLIACHHNSPLYIPYRIRMIAEVVGHTFSAQLSSLEDIEKNTHEQKRALLLERLSIAIQQNSNIKNLFISVAPLAMEALKSSGLALYSGNHTYSFGDTPNSQTLTALFEWLKQNRKNDVLHTEQVQALTGHVPALSRLDGGILALKVSLVNNDYAVWFRPNIQKEVRWAGNPEKPAEETRAGYRLTPRSSFELWKEISKGKSISWSEEDLQTANSIVKLFIESKQVAADQANLAKSEFMATVSHELRTPMNAILGISNILVGSQPLTDKQRMLISTLKGSADNLLTLINDLLDVAKIEAGAVELENISFHLPRLVEEVVSMLSVRAVEKGLQLDVTNHTEHPVTLCGDPTRLKQVLINLINNAVKFTEQGYVRLHISSIPRGEEKYDVMFEVHDSGIGIAPEKIATIFDKFTQADSSISRRFGGTGLGLSITKTLVDLLGGQIMVKSEVGAGSVFSFTVPLATVSSINAAQEEPAKEDAAQSTGPNIPKILVVEDLDANALVVGTFLEEFGYQHDRVKDGQQAVDAARQREYLAILMDVQMHGMNGFTATTEIRKLENAGIIQQRNYIIGMTAHALAGDRERCYAAGMDDYLPKPFNPKELRQKILAAIFSTRDFKRG